MPSISFLQLLTSWGFKFSYTILLFYGILAANPISAQQSNIGIYFQAIARDHAANPVNNRMIFVHATILNSAINGKVLFSETHQIQTDKEGVFSIAIGKGSWLNGTFNNISTLDWSTGIHFLNLKIAITPISPSVSWNYNNEWIDLGTNIFGVVPYAMNVIGERGMGLDSTRLNAKLNTTDTTSMLAAYIKKSALLDTSSLYRRIDAKVNHIDTNAMLLPYAKTALTPTLALFNTNLNTKLNISDSLLSYVTHTQLSSKTIDTTYLSNRINARTSLSNKSININALIDYNDEKYPSVKAIKDYVDNQFAVGAPDATIYNRGIIQLSGDLTGTALDPRIANNTITTDKLLDAAITDAKVATGIQSSKVGLANVTNHPQLYNLNGLTTQIQSLGTPSVNGLSPNWLSIGSSHILNLPMASASAVTAGLISKVEYDHFNAAYISSINSLTTNNSVGAATLTGQLLNIPNYTITGLSGMVNPNFILAGPINGSAGAVAYRTLVAADIPNHSANTSGNAATATKLQNARSINGILFDGSADININANTNNDLTFNEFGLGAASSVIFNGANARTISYNTIGAAPSAGSSSITTVGTITSGTWGSNVIGANFGGAGSINGILKANGSGVVTAATSGTDFQVPLGFVSPLNNSSNTISINQATSNAAGYLSVADWNSFNNKINATEKAAVNGVATLNELGKIPTSQIPSISFSSGYVVNTELEMLALSAAVVGSIAIRTDNSRNYVLSASDPSLLSNWLQLLMPAAVSSVNGYTTGSIVLTSSDIAEGTNQYFTNARVRTAVDAFLAGDAPISYNTSTGKMGITQSASNANGYLSSTDWTRFDNKQNTFGTQVANSFYAAPNGLSGTPIFRTILVADIPTLNQNTIGNAATATALQTARTINGVSFNGTANITIPSNTSNALTFNNSGLGALSSTSFDGSSPIIISYNSFGALPITGANTVTTLGTINSGIWNANVIGSNYGGAGSNIGLLKANGSGVVSAALAGTDFESPLSFSAPLTRTSNAISIQTATTNNAGILSASDWQLFNGKQSTIVAGTGVNLTGGNTINIGQSVATSSTPNFSGMTISGLNVSGVVVNSAAGILSTVGVTGSGLVVKENSPIMITPVLGVATATSIQVGTITATGSISSNGEISAKRFKLTMPNAISAAASTTIDMSLGNVFTLNLVANITTLTLTNPAVGTYLIKFVQDATGSRTVAFPGGWKWAGGTAPTITSTATKLDIVTLIYDGATYYTTIVKNF